MLLQFKKSRVLTQIDNNLDIIDYKIDYEVKKIISSLSNYLLIRSLSDNLKSFLGINISKPDLSWLEHLKNDLIKGSDVSDMVTIYDKGFRWYLKYSSFEKDFTPIYDLYIRRRTLKTMYSDIRLSDGDMVLLNHHNINTLGFRL